MIFKLKLAELNDIAGTECLTLTLRHDGGLQIFFFCCASQLPLTKRKGTPRNQKGSSSDDQESG